MTEGSAIAAASAEQQSGGNNWMPPADGISKANQAGSLIVIDSGVTESARLGRA